MGRIIGIDLGTTFSAAAHVDADGRPRIIPNADGDSTTPSVVLVEDGRIEVGAVAMNQWVTNRDHVIRWVKRAMGEPDYRFQGLTATEVSAQILKRLKADAELYFGEPVDEAVITCPAYFAATEIENTRRAGELAGFRVREIVKEPTAAAVYYGVENMRDGETVLVTDLGGGTFDATILRFQNGVFTPLCSAGDRKLGGHDWTSELVDLVAERFEVLHGDDPRNDLVASQLLYEACETAKRAFSQVAETTVSCQHAGRIEHVTVTRAAFEARTEYLVEQIVQWAEAALRKADPPLEWKGVTKILLVGGSVKLRRVSEALEQASGRKPIRTADAELMVALGAAVLASGRVRPRKGGLVEGKPAGGLVEVMFDRIVPRNMGTRVIRTRKDGARLINSQLIPKNTKVPLVRSREDYEISSDGQPFIEIPVVEFEDEEGEFECFGNFQFQCVPSATKGDKVRVTFSYDESTIPSVEALDLRSGKTLPVEKLTNYQDPDLSQILRMRVKPRWVVFAVDCSGSMDGIKIETARQAVIQNARDLLKLGTETCKIGLVTFSSQAQARCQPTSDIQLIESAVSSMVAYGMTAMDEGINLAIEMVAGAPPTADRDVVLVTDGVPDDRRRDSTFRAAELARTRKIALSTLGLGKEDVDEDFLRQLTPVTLVIDQVAGMADAMTKLLTQSDAARGGGLMETRTGGLEER